MFPEEEVANCVRFAKVKKDGFLRQSHVISVKTCRITPLTTILLEKLITSFFELTMCLLLQLLLCLNYCITYLHFFWNILDGVRDLF